MSMVELSVEALKESVFKRVAECRRSLSEGGADFSGLEDRVRLYCEAVAALSAGDMERHTQALASLLEQVEALREALDLARESVRKELTGLNRLKQANVAYQTSDGFGPVHRPRNEDE